MAHLGHGGFYTAQLLPLAAADVDVHLVAGKVNVFIYMEIVNSISHYDTGSNDAFIVSQTVADHVAMFVARRAAGWNFCIHVNMYYPSYYDARLRSIMDSINAALRARTDIINATVDLAVDTEINQVPANFNVINSGDGIHPLDYGHLCIYDDALVVIQNLYASITIVTIPFDPATLGRLLWRFTPESANLVVDGSNNVSTWYDRSTWGFDLTAAGALRPVFSGGTVNGAGSSTMTTALSAILSFTSRVEVFAQCSLASANTILAELSTNYTAVADSFGVLTSAGNAPEMAAVGNVGTSSDIATAVAGLQKWSFILDNTVSTNQVSILLNGAPAAGQVHVDAPNTNALAPSPGRTLSVFGRAGGTLGSTASIKRLLIFGRPLTAPQRAALLAWAT